MNDRLMPTFGVVARYVLKRRVTWLRRLCALQVVSIAGAVVIAAWVIQTIVISGPLISALGLVVLTLAVFEGRWLLSLFGVSAAIFSIGVFFLIFFNRWSPTDAERPVQLILLGYEAAVIPAGLLGLYRLNRHPSAEVRIPMQFSLRWLFLVTLLAGLDLGVVRLAMVLGEDALGVIAVGLGAAALLGTIGVLLATRQAMAAAAALSSVQHST